jgi:hypothetical protein
VTVKGVYHTSPAFQSTVVFAFEPDKDSTRAYESVTLHFVESPNDWGKEALADSLKDNMGVMSVSNMKAGVSGLLHGVGDMGSLESPVFIARRMNIHSFVRERERKVVSSKPRRHNVNV